MAEWILKIYLRDSLTRYLRSETHKENNFKLRYGHSDTCIRTCKYWYADTLSDNLSKWLMTGKKNRSYIQNLESVSGKPSGYHMGFIWKLCISSGIWNALERRVCRARKRTSIIWKQKGPYDGFCGSSFGKEQLEPNLSKWFYFNSSMDM